MISGHHPVRVVHRRRSVVENLWLAHEPVSKDDPKNRRIFHPLESHLIQRVVVNRWLLVEICDQDALNYIEKDERDHCDRKKHGQGYSEHKCDVGGAQNQRVLEVHQVDGPAVQVYVGGDCLGSGPFRFMAQAEVAFVPVALGPLLSVETGPVNKYIDGVEPHSGDQNRRDVQVPVLGHILIHALEHSEPSEARILR